MDSLAEQPWFSFGCFYSPTAKLVRELQLQQHFHEPVVSAAAAAQSLKAQLESSILALALWLPTKASLFTSFITGKPCFPPLKIAKAASERFLKEIKPTSIPYKQLKELVMPGLFQGSLLRTSLRIPSKDFSKYPQQGHSQMSWPSIPTISDGLKQATSSLPCLRLSTPAAEELLCVTCSRVTVTPEQHHQETGVQHRLAEFKLLSLIST